MVVQRPTSARNEAGDRVAGLTPRPIDRLSEDDPEYLIALRPLARVIAQLLWDHARREAERTGAQEGEANRVRRSRRRNGGSSS
jgi:hypothetical protein